MILVSSSTPGQQAFELLGLSNKLGMSLATLATGKHLQIYPGRLLSRSY